MSNRLNLNTFQKNLCKLVLVGAVSVALASCGSPPKRALYQGTDQVSAVDRGALVGKWQASVLNPFDGEPDVNSVVTLNADSTFLMRTEVNPVQDDHPGVTTVYSGSWGVSNGALFYKDITVVDSKASMPDEYGDTAENKALWEQASGGLMSLAANAATSFMNSRGTEANSSNVLELSANRIVLLGQPESGTNPVAYEYTRL